MEAFGLSDPGCVRKNNEDYYFIDPQLGVYLLADGMGGAQAGELASRLAVETTVQFIATATERSKESLINAFQEANRKVLSTAAASANLNGMGTTLVGVLEMGDGNLAIASVGDSRAYQFGEGELSPITQDQTWANEVGRRLGLDDERLKNHPMRHVLTMAIGVEVNLRVHSYSLKPSSGSHLLLCSDGLHGVVPAGNISKELNRVGDLESKCHYLIDAARKAGGPDNITAVLLKVQ